MIVVVVMAEFHTTVVHHTQDGSSRTSHQMREVHHQRRSHSAKKVDRRRYNASPTCPLFTRTLQRDGTLNTPENGRI